MLSSIPAPTIPSHRPPPPPHIAVPGGSSNHPLAELIAAENEYIKKLSIVEEHLAPLCSNTNHVLTIRNILLSNMRFVTELSTLSGPSAASMKVLGDVLVQWLDNLKAPYSKYFHNDNVIARDLDNDAVHRCLAGLSPSTTLQSLLEAPGRRLDHYKEIYHRLLKSAEPGRADHRMLLSAIQQIEALQKSSASNNTFLIKEGSMAVPGSSELRAFLDRLDCSRTVDFQTGVPKQIDPAQSFARDKRIILQDSFGLLPEPIRQVHAVLTNASLIIITTDERAGAHVLLYPPIDVDQITVNSKMLDRELAGEYFVQFTVHAQHFITLRANHKETRNKWVGVRAGMSSSSTLAPRSLRNVVEVTLATQQQEPSPPPLPRDKETGKIAALKTHDFFTFYQDQSGEISPLSSDDEFDSGGANFGSKSGGPTALARPTIPPVPLKDEKHEVPTLLTPTSDGPSSMLSEGSSRSASPLTRPTTPRTIEISHAVAPVTPMQAISQRTSEMMLLQKALPPPTVITPRKSSNPNGGRPPPPAKQATCPSFSTIPNRAPSPGPYLKQSHPHHQQQRQQHQQHQQQQQQQQPKSNQLQVQPQLRPQRSMPELTAGQSSRGGSGQEQGKVLYSHDHCQVFHWKSDTWYGVDGSCTIQIRQMAPNSISGVRSCLSIEMKRTRQLYLNAWILPTTQISHASPTDVTVSVAMPTGKETYLCHLPAPPDASAFFQTLQRAHQLASAAATSKKTTSYDDDDDFKSDQSSVRQSLRPLMQCSAKLYVQSEHSKWSSLGGNLTTKISHQQPSGRMHIEVIDSKDKKLISAIVQGRNVGQLSPKRITLLLGDDKQSMVYMIKVKEETVGAKLYEYLKVKNQAQP